MELYTAALIVVTLANAAAVTRMLIIRAQRTLPFLFLFVSYQFLQNLLAVFVSPGTRRYELLYTYAEPLNWVLYVFTVREMYRLAFAEFPGIVGVARWTASISAVLTAVVSVIMMYTTESNATNVDLLFGYIILWEKCACFALAVFITWMVFLLFRYPIKLGSNIAANIAIFTPYFFGIFVSLQITSAETRTLLVLRDYLFLGLSAGCYLAWSILLKKSAETFTVTTVRRDPNEQKRLLDQLAAMNRLLGKSIHPGAYKH